MKLTKKETEHTLDDVSSISYRNFITGGVQTVLEILKESSEQKLIEEEDTKYFVTPYFLNLLFMK